MVFIPHCGFLSPFCLLRYNNFLYIEEALQYVRPTNRIVFFSLSLSVKDSYARKMKIKSNKNEWGMKYIYRQNGNNLDQMQLKTFALF